MVLIISGEAVETKSLAVNHKTGKSMGTFAAITDQRTGSSTKNVCCRKLDIQLSMLSMFDIAGEYPLTQGRKNYDCDVKVTTVAATAITTTRHIPITPQFLDMHHTQGTHGHGCAISRQRALLQLHWL